MTQNLMSWHVLAAACWRWDIFIMPDTQKYVCSHLIALHCIVVLIQEQNEEHLKMGEALGETCYQMFVSQKAGVSPEYVRFNDVGMQSGVDFYILRPETVETMMYLYRITKDEKWRQKGWQIYQNIVAATKVSRGGVGYSPVLSVGHNPHHDPKGVMHSFFLAETLKYLYLLFSDDSVIPLDKFVFNTEAHPILIPDDTFAPK